ncbi:MAG: type II toxin-antitoxin system VapC family toxin [Thiomargarita sp.]|nr:type II toxin-antitoxin system VapC family toxin [Thiomargarita sp.]
MMNYMGIEMLVSLDTNIWIFGLLKNNEFCQKILLNLSNFNFVVPNQVRIELVHNLPNTYMKEFYQLVNESNIQLNYEQVPNMYIEMFESKGLKKGDAIIGGFAEWQKIDKIVSDNRDFLRGLSAGHHFEVMSPQAFCEKFGL